MWLKSLAALAMLMLSLAQAGCSSSKTTEVRSGSLGDRHADEDGDIQVALADCPAAVQATIAQHVGGGSINEIELAPDGNYEVDANGADGDSEFIVASDGTYLGSEIDDDDGDDDGPDDDD